MSRTGTRSKAAGARRRQTGKPAKAARHPADFTDEQIDELGANLARDTVTYRRYFKQTGGAFSRDENGKMHFTKEALDFLTMFYQASQEYHGAPKRCRNKDCRKGRCHLYIDDENALNCPGGISQQALNDMEAMLYGFVTVCRYCMPNLFEGYKA